MNFENIIVYIKNGLVMQNRFYTNSAILLSSASIGRERREAEEIVCGFRIGIELSWSKMGI